MRQFLIFGRPRSRTAWVANFLTVPDQSFCHHEAMSDAGNPIELQGRLQESSYIPTGNSDTGMIHTPLEILRFFPDARLVMLTGAHLSWKRFADEKRIPARVVQRVDEDYQAAKAILRDRGALFVDVHRLMKEVPVARELWHHCTGMRFTFNPIRYRMLRDLNIQVMQESLARRIASRLPRG